MDMVFKSSQMETYTEESILRENSTGKENMSGQMVLYMKVNSWRDAAMDKETGNPQETEETYI